MEFVNTALEAAWYGVVFSAIITFIGFGASAFLLPRDWYRYRSLLSPLLGWSILVLSLFLVNLVVGVQIGAYVVLFLALIANVVAVRRTGLPGLDWREAGVPIALGVGLVALALIPHIAQRSLGFLVLNQDEEIYYPVANYLLSYPSTQDSHLMSAPFERWRPWGWGFQYTVAAVSAVSGGATFQTYLPTIYFLLGLSVLAWYFLMREVLQLTRSESVVTVFFYCLLGLPLWFGAYGYGPQVASYVALPLGTTLFIAAAERGGPRRIVLAGVAVAAGLVSFYRGIGLQYMFIFVPVVLVAVAQRRVLRPVWRALAVVAVVLIAGLPGHWDAGRYYFVQGAILSPDRLDMTGGWGLDYFQPNSVMLGLDAFPMARDEEGMRPLARLDSPLGMISDPMAWIVLAISALGLAWMSRRRPMVLAVVVGSAVALGFNRFAINFPYGYVKLMPVAAPLVYGLFVAALGRLSSLTGSITNRRAARMVARLMVSLMLVVTLLLGYTTYDAVWSNATGWGLSIPSWIPEHVRQIKEVIPPGSRLFMSGSFDYPVPEDRLRTRQHMLGMRTEEEHRAVWGQRVRSIVLTELLSRNVYAWSGDGLLFSKFRRLLDDESYDFYLLGSENDPRLEGLDATDRIWSDSGLSVYSAKDVVRTSPWLIRHERGSLAITSDHPFSMAVSTSAIDTRGVGLPPSAPGVGRVRIGILAFERSRVTVTSPAFSRDLPLEEGLTWYTTPNIELPSGLSLASHNGVGLVSIRVLPSGSEEKVLVPRTEMGYDLYASSTLLRLDDWLTDPFKGKKPGSS